MFDLAYKKACGFVEPIITLSQFENEGPYANYGTAILLNNDGYFLTAGHILSSHLALRDKIESRNNNNDRFEVRLGKYEGHILSHKIFEDVIDLGVGKFSAQFQLKEYPVFREKGIVEGEFLCRVGFPFVSELIDDFEVNHDALDPYVNQALVSQVIVCRDDGPEIRLFETNPNGFPGHSGAPILDKDGYICGVDTKTNHREIPLPYRTGEILTRILSFGWGVDSKTVRTLLDKEEIDYQMKGIK